jgi:two-component system, OmpR family, phosphate regulon sensor histidine kinase PhoR
MKPAIQLSLFSSVIVALATVLWFYIAGNNSSLAFVFICVFVCSFVIHFFVFEYYFFRKIKSISSRIKIQSPSVNDEFLRKHSESLEHLDVKAEQWMAERLGETERVEKLENYRKDLLGNVSHELKTPIFNIQGYISTLLNGGLEDASINRNYLERAEKSVDRMIAIVQDLQAITQLEKGELEIDEEAFDIVSLTKEVIESLERKAGEKKIILELVNDVNISITVLADRFRIRQVLVNLIGNSISYGKENGKTTVTINDAGLKAIVQVADTGIGIAEKHLPRIFERFYRADKSRSRELGGTGLGLAIVKHIIEAHHQKINVTSKEGEGTVFTFTLKKA